MRKYLLLTMALAGLIAVSVAGVAVAGKAASEKFQIGTLIFEGGGSFTPKKLSKTKQTPIALSVDEVSVEVWREASD